MKKIYIFTLLVVFSSFGCATNGMATRDIALSNQLAIQKQREEIGFITNTLFDFHRSQEFKILSLEKEIKNLHKILCEKHPEDCPPSVLER